MSIFRKKRILFAAVIVLGVVTRLLVIICFSGVGLKRDSLKFLAAAEKIAAGDPTALASQQFQPLYPMLLSVGCRLGFPLTFGYVLNMVCAVGVMCCAYRIVAAMLKSRPAGYAAMFFCALHPLLLEIDTSLLRDSLYLCLFALAAVLTIRIANGGGRVAAALLGAVCGAAPLTRAEGWELAVYFLIFCLLANRGRRFHLSGGKISLRDMGICFLMMFAVYLLVCVYSSGFGYYWLSVFSHQSLFVRHIL